MRLKCTCMWIAIACLDASCRLYTIAHDGSFDEDDIGCVALDESNTLRIASACDSYVGFSPGTRGSCCRASESP